MEQELTQKCLMMLNRSSIKMVHVLVERSLDGLEKDFFSYSFLKPPKLRRWSSVVSPKSERPLLSELGWWKKNEQKKMATSTVVTSNFKVGQTFYFLLEVCACFGLF